MGTKRFQKRPLLRSINNRQYSRNDRFSLFRKSSREGEAGMPFKLLLLEWSPIFMDVCLWDNIPFSAVEPDAIPFLGVGEFLSDISVWGYIILVGRQSENEGSFEPEAVALVSKKSNGNACCYFRQQNISSFAAVVGEINRRSRSWRWCFLNGWVLCHIISYRTRNKPSMVKSDNQLKVRFLIFLVRGTYCTLLYVTLPYWSTVR